MAVEKVLAPSNSTNSAAITVILLLRGIVIKQLATLAEIFSKTHTTVDTVLANLLFCTTEWAYNLVDFMAWDLMSFFLINTNTILYFIMAMTAIKYFITTGSSDTTPSPIMCTSMLHVFPLQHLLGVIWFLKGQRQRIKLLSVHSSYLLSSACHMLIFFRPNWLRLWVSCNLCHGKIISSNAGQWLNLDRSLKHLHIGRTLAMILKPEKACYSPSNRPWHCCFLLYSCRSQHISNKLSKKRCTAPIIRTPWGEFIQKRRVLGTHIITTTQHWGTPEPPALNSDHLHIMITWFVEDSGCNSH